MSGQMSTGSPGVFSEFFSIGRGGGNDQRGTSRRVMAAMIALAATTMLLGAALVLYLAGPARADNGFQVTKTIWPMSNDCNALGSSLVGPSYDQYEGFVGVPISFCVVVFNGGSDPVQNIVLTDDNTTPTVATDDTLLTLTDASGAPITSLAPGFKGYAIHTVTPSVVGDFTNTVAATGESIDGAGVVTPVSSSDTAEFDIYDISFDKTSTAGSSVTEGDSVTFTFTVTNNAGSNGVTYLVNGLIDSVFGDLTDLTVNPTSDCNTLVGQTVPALGGTASCQLTVTMGAPGPYLPADFAPGAGGTHSNMAELMGEDQFGNPVGGSDTETFIVEDDPASITVTKLAMPDQVAAPGGMVDFTVGVTNNSTVDVIELTSFVDDMFGPINTECLIDPMTMLALTVVVLAPGQTHTCQIVTRMVSGAPGDIHTNTVTVSGNDDDSGPITGDATEEVEIVGASSIDLTKTASPVSVSEPGDDVTFTFTVVNTGATTITLSSLMDTMFGDLTDLVVNPTSTCATVGTAPLLPGDSYSCQLTQFLSGTAGDVHFNLATFCGTDGTVDAATGMLIETCAADDENVDFVELGAIKVRKRADLSEVPASGADVTFRFIISNTGGIDVTLTELVDTIYGDISVECGIDDAAGNLTPIVLVPAPGPGDSYECEIVRNVSGTAGTEHKNRVTATGEDANGNDVDDRGTKKIQIVADPDAAISIVKTANPTSVPATGGNVDFTFTVTNDSVVGDVSVTSLIDSIYGDITADCGWVVAPPQLTPGQTATCTITRPVAPVSGGSGGGGGTTTSSNPASTNTSQTYLSPPAPAACSGTSWVAGANTTMGSHTNHSLVLNTGLSLAAGTWSVDDFTAWDADIDRPSYPQASEIVRVEFHLNGTLVAASNATPDLPDGFVTAWVSGGLGSVTLPNGADEVKLVHSNSFAGTSGTNSLQPISLCLIASAVTTPATGDHTNTATVCATDAGATVLCADDEATVTFDAPSVEPPACVGGNARWWRNNQGQWVAPYSPGTSVQTLFNPVSNNWTMYQALALAGNNSFAGRERQLIREATAAILNEAANPSNYPVSSISVIQQAVDNALASGSRSEMRRVARILYRWNRDVCR